MKISGFIDQKYVKTVIKDRKKEQHKGDFGKILVVAGSKGMAGAAVLCAKAALKSGAGLVRVSVDDLLFPIIQTAVPEATCISRRFALSALDDYDAVAIGPGLGDGAENGELVEFFINNYDGALVLDADGLNALARTKKAHILKKARAKVIITPHIGEAKRLIPEGKLKNEWPKGDIYSEESRCKIADLLLEETESIVVLKGPGSIVASLKEGAFVNTTGNPGMATGGSGDVLTGIIAALAGQTKCPWDSAKAGVFIHGMAGDIAAEAYGEYGMTAMDIADKTAFAFKEITGKRR